MPLFSDPVSLDGFRRIGMSSGSGKHFKLTKKNSLRLKSTKLNSTKEAFHGVFCIAQNFGEKIIFTLNMTILT